MRGKTRPQTTKAEIRGREPRRQAGRSRRRVEGELRSSVNADPPTRWQEPHREKGSQGIPERKCELLTKISQKQRDATIDDKAFRVLREMIYQKQGPAARETIRPPSVGQAEMLSLSQGLSSHSRESHRMYSSKTRQETKKAAALGAETQAPTRGWRWPPGVGCQGESVTESWGEMETLEMHSI